MAVTLPKTTACINAAEETGTVSPQLKSDRGLCLRGVFVLYFFVIQDIWGHVLVQLTALVTGEINVLQPKQPTPDQQQTCFALPCVFPWSELTLFWLKCLLYLLEFGITSYHVAAPQSDSEHVCQCDLRRVTAGEVFCVNLKYIIHELLCSPLFQPRQRCGSDGWRTSVLKFTHETQHV